VATALTADKLILLGAACGLIDERGQLQRQLTPDEAHRWRSDAAPGDEMPRHLKAASAAARHGVARTHLLSWRDHDALLAELFTRDGVGTMISRHHYEQLRAAQVADVGGLLELLEPLEQRGMLVPRSRERLEYEIDDYVVIERDGMVIGCAALHGVPQAVMGELACVAVHVDYRGGLRGDLLLEEVERRARQQGLDTLFALTTHTAHWFYEHGFRAAQLADLPPLKRDTYNHARQSKVLVKSLR
jgi:amino-acid N-acetyltransferase